MVSVTGLKNPPKITTIEKFSVLKNLDGPMKFKITWFLFQHLLRIFPSLTKTEDNHCNQNNNDISGALITLR